MISDVGFWFLKSGFSVQGIVVWDHEKYRQQFATGVNDIRDNLLPVSTTPASNLSPGTISGCWEWVWKLILYLLFCRDNSRKPTPSVYSAYSINKFEWKLTQASLKDCKIYRLNRVENCRIFCTVKTEFVWRDKCTTLLYGGHTGGIKFFLKQKLAEVCLL